MSSRDEELNHRALTYLMTAVIHRLHETDPTWWRGFLDDMKSQRNAAGVMAQGDREVLKRAISIVEHSLKP